MDSCFIPVEVNTDQYAQFEQIAREKGMDLSQWLVSLAVTYQTQKNTPQLQEAGQKVASINAQKQNPIKHQIITVSNANHPCLHLLGDKYPVPHDAKSCQGTCMYNEKRGAPCFFNPSSARMCPYFTAKRQIQ